MNNNDESPNDDQAEQQAIELLVEAKVPIVGLGMSFSELLDRFLTTSSTQQNLDSWLPLGNATVQNLFATVLLGLAQRLGAEFNIPTHTVKAALAFSCVETNFFYGKDATDTVNLVLHLPEVKSSKDSVYQLFYASGVGAAKKWLAAGLVSTPDSDVLKTLVTVFEKYGPESIVNPHNVLDKIRPYLNPYFSQSDDAQFFFKHQYFFRLVFTKYYPIQEVVLDVYKDQFSRSDWANISTNRNLNWSSQLISRFRDYWDWSGLSGNVALPWSKELISYFFVKSNCDRQEDELEWFWLSGNEALPWSEELIEEFYGLWRGVGLSGNQAIPWSAKLIDRFEYALDWGHLSYNTNLPWSPEFIARYIDKWNFEYLSQNPAIHWFSDSLLERYADKIHWKGISQNAGLPWSLSAIDKYGKQLDWTGLSSNSKLPWSMELFNKYIDQWSWDGGFYGGLSGNCGFPWSYEFIDQHSECLDWNQLQANRGLPWSIELLKRYDSRWKWSTSEDDLSSLTFNSLSSNSAIPWSKDLIDEFSDKIDFERLSDHFDGCIQEMSVDEITRLLDEVL